MSKHSQIVYGTPTLAKMLGVPLDNIKYLIRRGKIHPKKFNIGDRAFNVYSPEDVEEIKKHTGMN